LFWGKGVNLRGFSTSCPVIAPRDVIDSFYQGQSYTLPSGIIVDSPGVYQSIIMTASGCDSIINTILSFRIPSCIKVSNAFTPNGDGYNDKWEISQGNCNQQLKVSVYNRWGGLVYHSDNYNNDWDGNYDSKQLPDATYYYVIQVLYPDGRQQELTGNVTIMR
jgi:gliding motility-associated-like protein